MSERGAEPMEAPCKKCGYNGPGYYQPETHRCAGPDVEGERPKWELTLAEYHAIRRERDRFGMALSSARGLIRELLREGKFNVKVSDRARAILKDLDSDARSNDDGGRPDGC